MPTVIDMETVYLFLADVEVECHCWYVFDRNEGRTETIRKRPKDNCPDCKGSGDLRPLRRECSKHGQHRRSHVTGLCTRCNEYPGNVGPQCVADCPCQGRRYLFNITMESLAKAIRAKGWHLWIFACGGWDVHVMDGSRRIGQVDHDEGLHDCEALALAFARAAGMKEEPNG